MSWNIWRKIAVTCFALAAVFSLLAKMQSGDTQAEQASEEVRVNLSDHNWKDRVLVILYDEDTPEHLTTQREALGMGTDEGAKELGARDMVIYEVPHHGSGRRVDYALDGSKETATLPEETCASIRAQLDREGPSEVYTVLLIGKDGGVKLTQHEVLRDDALFERIDSMPMRQREMKERGR